MSRFRLAKLGSLSGLVFAASVVFCMVVRVEVSAEDYRKLHREGASLYGKGRYYEAIERFRKALAAAPEDARESVSRDLARALAGFGIASLDAGESKRAHDAFQESLEVAEDWFAHFGLGFLWFQRRRDAEALTHLLRSLELNDSDAATHKLLGILDYRRGEMRSALARLKRARELDGKDRETRELLERWREESRVTETFVEKRTRHFVLRVDPRLPAAVRDRAIDLLSRARAEVGDRLGVWPKKRLPCTFFSGERFHEATGMEHWVGGLYDGQLKLPVPESLEDEKRLAELERVLRHEYTHVLVRSLAPECPMWLNEGIAQLLEEEREPDAVYRTLAAARSSYRPIASLPANLSAVHDVETARQIYLEGLAFTTFLAERYGAFRIRLLLRALDEEHSTSRAFSRVYGRGLEDLESALLDRIDP